MTPESAYYVVAATAFPIGALWALLQWRASVKQRKEELRWRQAEAAWKLLDKIFEDPDAVIAFELIDGERDTLDLPDVGRVSVSLDDALNALDLGSTDRSPTGPIIRYSFNCVLYALDRLEVAMTSGYVLEEDVKSPTVYYARILYGLRSRFEPYASAAGYDRALSLIVRLGSEPHPVGTFLARPGRRATHNSP